MNRNRIEDIFLGDRATMWITTPESRHEIEIEIEQRLIDLDLMPEEEAIDSIEQTAIGNTASGDVRLALVIIFEGDTESVTIVAA